MPRPERNGERHEVHWSIAVANIARRLQRQAAAEGRGDEFLSALRQIHRYRRRDPAHFGDLLFRLPALRMQVRKAAVWPIVIHFGVTADEFLVVIRGVFLMPYRRS
jgi:hypothetical protein